MMMMIMMVTTMMILVAWSLKLRRQELSYLSHVSSSKSIFNAALMKALHCSWLLKEYF
jgi:hypothetical protein